jgi:hypothetical protein
MYGNTITDEKRQILKRYLTTNDYKKIAVKGNSSLSTVCNIMHQRQVLNKSNYMVYETIIDYCTDKIKDAIVQSQKDFDLI